MVRYWRVLVFLAALLLAGVGAAVAQSAAAPAAVGAKPTPIVLQASGGSAVGLTASVTVLEEEP